jgi:hypothetical protein
MSSPFLIVVMNMHSKKESKMKFIPFNEQYDEEQLVLIPFDLQRHCYKPNYLELKVSKDHPDFEEMVSLVIRYSSNFNAEVQVTFLSQYTRKKTSNSLVVEKGFQQRERFESIEDVSQLNSILDRISA